ncbi:MAG: DUF3291 domain-containing protein [Devosiaceae bacterium]|nr:DUF3291 domain-containing protein [Devosiaceae bacterium MH13]
MHLAELNIAEWTVSPESEAARSFFGALDRVNAVAERSPGFVWRPVNPVPASRDPWAGSNVIVNMSVWETPEHLEHFVWNTAHRAIYRRKAEWFSAMRMAHFVMWWIEPGHRPTLQEAKARLDHLHEHGQTDTAFGWEHLPHVKLWQSQRCG